MERQTINVLINKFTQRITIKLTRSSRNLIVMLFFLSACLLLTLKHYIFTGVLFGFLAGEFVYLTTIIKKKMLTIYSGVGVSFVLLGNIGFFFNVWMYGIQKSNGVYDPILLIGILLIEVLCLIAGFFYTCRCVKKGTIRTSKAAIATPIAFVLPSALGYFLSRYISNKVSVHIQNVLFTTMFALAGSMVMFILGMVHIAIIYYIKKYNIGDRELSNEL